jgi:hypothetical protein
MFSRFFFNLQPKVKIDEGDNSIDYNAPADAQLRE